MAGEPASRTSSSRNSPIAELTGVIHTGEH